MAFTFGLPERAFFAEARDELRTRLDAATFERELAAGGALSLEEAVGAAGALLDAADATEPTAAEVDAGFGLTPRELDVLRLVVAGQTDREIAASLYISRRTAEWHVASILGKLGVRSRAAAVAVAIRAGLVAPEEASPA